MRILFVMDCLLLGLGCAAPTQAAEPRFPGAAWEEASPESVGMNPGRLDAAERYALTAGGSGCVVRHGMLVRKWGPLDQRYDLKSTTKSIGVTALGLALLDGKIRLEDKAIRFQPGLGVPPKANRETGWLNEITILHLATQTAGFEKPGGYTKLLFQPGTRWDYSDSGPNWLAECLTLIYGRDLNELMFNRVFTPIGIGPADLKWRPNQYRPHELNGIQRREFGSGISANVNAMARIGYLYLREGIWNGRRILPAAFVKAARSPVAGVRGLAELNVKDYGNASDHYGLLWWNNADGTLIKVPRDAYWSWGLYDSLIVVVPSLDLVAARAGRSWKRESNDHYHVLKGFLEPLTEAAQSGAPSRDGN